MLTVTSLAVAIASGGWAVRWSIGAFRRNDSFDLWFGLYVMGLSFVLATLAIRL